MDGISIELLTPERMPEAIDVTCRAFGEEWRESAEKDFAITFSDYPHPFTTLIAVKDNNIIGVAQCLTAYLTPNAYMIAWVCVEPKLQGQGIGSFIMKQACNHIEENFLKGKSGTIFLVSAIDYKFYEKFGFKKGPDIHSKSPIMLKIIEGN